MAANFCLLVGKICLLLFGQLFKAQKVIDGRTILFSLDGNKFFFDKLGKIIFDATDAA